MKYVLLTLLLALPAMADSPVKLAWDANPEPDIAGYELSYGPLPGSRPNIIKVGNVITAQTPPLKEGVTYYFAVQARNSRGVLSAPSDEVIYTVPITPPAKPANLRVVKIETSSNLKDWETIAYVPLLTDSPARFIRANISDILPTP